MNRTGSSRKPKSVSESKKGSQVNANSATRLVAGSRKNSSKTLADIKSIEQIGETIKQANLARSFAAVQESHTTDADLEHWGDGESSVDNSLTDSPNQERMQSLSIKYQQKGAVNDWCEEGEDYENDFEGNPRGNLDERDSKNDNFNSEGWIRKGNLGFSDTDEIEFLSPNFSIDQSTSRNKIAISPEDTTNAGIIFNNKDDFERNPRANIDERDSKNDNIDSEGWIRKGNLSFSDANETKFLSPNFSIDQSTLRNKIAISPEDTTNAGIIFNKDIGVWEGGEVDMSGFDSEEELELEAKVDKQVEVSQTKKMFPILQGKVLGNSFVQDKQKSPASQVTNEKEIKQCPVVSRPNRPRASSTQDFELSSAMINAFQRSEVDHAFLVKHFSQRNHPPKSAKKRSTSKANPTKISTPTKHHPKRSTKQIQEQSDMESEKMKILDDIKEMSIEKIVANVKRLNFLEDFYARQRSTN